MSLRQGDTIVAGLGTPLPSQSGQSGKFLTTNGSTASWGEVDAFPDQLGQSGKFLTTNGQSTSWAEVAATTTITYWTDD